MSTESWLDEHGTELTGGLASLRAQAATVERWGHRLAEKVRGGSRLLAAGNGGSAAEAQHLTGEIVGRFLGERRPFSAIPLCADSAAVTAIVNRTILFTHPTQVTHGLSLSHVFRWRAKLAGRA